MLFATVFLSIGATLVAADPTVSIADGQLRGKYRITKAGTNYSSYEGIPFAAPPVGSLRFAPPQPPIPWEGVLDVVDSDVACVQSGGQENPVYGTEDCLYLNVWVPNKPNRTEPLSVMMWIFGGGLVNGDNGYNTWGPNLWMDQDVIIVSPNMRLGPLGFTSLGIEEAPGNQGFLDLVAALKWINTNIDAFGGDPGSVTVFGVSSGSWAASYLTMTPLANGLFQRAILQSGSVFTPYWLWHTEEDSVLLSNYLTEALNCSVTVNEDPYGGLECLQEMSLEVLQSTQQWGSDETFQIQKIFRPHGTIDGKFLVDNPVKLMQTGEYNHVDLMIGFTKDEAMLQVYIMETNPSLYFLIQLAYKNMCPMFLFGRAANYFVTEEDLRLCDVFTEYYLQSKTNFNHDHLQNVSDMITDASFWYGAHKQAEWAVLQGDNVYQYKFSFKGRYGMANGFGLDNSLYGVAHADEVYYYWQPIGVNQIELDERETRLSQRVLLAWSDFAKTGNPKSAEVPWEPVLADKHQYLNIDDEFSMELADTYIERMSLWDAEYQFPEGNTIPQPVREALQDLVSRGTNNRKSTVPQKFPGFL